MLTSEELDVLKYDLKYRIDPIHENKTDVLTAFDFIIRTITYDKIQNTKNKVVNSKQSYQTWQIVTITITDNQCVL